MTREQFLAIVPAPGMMLVEPETDDRPCDAVVDQPCRILRHAPGYASSSDEIFAVGTVVMLSQLPARSHLWFEPGQRPLMLLEVERIMGRAPRR